jgi:hypothetical protein
MVCTWRSGNYGDQPMTTMTLRGIDDTRAKSLKETARREYTSVNAVMLRIINAASRVTGQSPVTFLQAPDQPDKSGSVDSDALRVRKVPAWNDLSPLPELQLKANSALIG